MYLGNFLDVHYIPFSFISDPNFFHTDRVLLVALRYTSLERQFII